MNIAVVVEGGLVETLQATPLLRALAEAGEDVRVVLCAPPSAAILAPGLPGVGELLPLRALGRPRWGLAGLLAAWRALRRRRIQAVILCTTSPSARWLTWCAGISRRVGPAGGPTARLLSHPIPVQAGENNAASWLGATRELGIAVTDALPAFDPGAEARERAAELLLGSGAEDGRLLVAMAPGLAAVDGVDLPPEQLTWPAERYAHLCNQLHRRHGAGVILVGSPDDVAAAEQMRVDLAAPCLDLCGQLSVREIAAVLERSDLFVGGDSPLLQLAAAMRIPTMGIFGGTDAHRRAGYGPDARAVQGLAEPPPERSDGRPSLVKVPDPPIARVRVDDVLAWVEAAAG